MSWNYSPYAVWSAQPLSAGRVIVVMLAGGAGRLYTHSPFNSSIKGRWLYRGAKLSENRQLKGIFVYVSNLCFPPTSLCLMVFHWIELPRKTKSSMPFLTSSSQPHCIHLQHVMGKATCQQSVPTCNRAPAPAPEEAPHFCFCHRAKPAQNRCSDT